MSQVKSIEKNLNLKSGYVTLVGSTGKHYRNLALEVPGYGMVPCSRKLENDFTTNSNNLVLVIFDLSDIDAPCTSDIWITKTETTSFW